MKRILVILVMLIAINTNAQWVQMSNGIPSGESCTTLAMNGNNIFAGTFQSGVYISTNNGSSWTQTSLNNVGVFSFAVNGNYIIAGTSAGVCTSTNNGTSWSLPTLTNTPATSLVIQGNTFLAGVSVWSPYGSSYGIYISTNNGNTWTLSSMDRTVRSLVLSGNKAFAGTVYYGIYYSTNSGVSWMPTILGGGVVYSLSALNNRIVAGTDNGVALSTDNGTVWAYIGLQNMVESVVFSGNNIFAGLNHFFSNDAGVHLTTNNGINWISVNQGLGPNPPTVRALLIKDNYIFAGTELQLLWRRPLSEVIGIQNISTETPSKYSLSQNYPNPFNPTTNIKFSIVNSEDVKLVVYDIQGREVQTLVNERLQPGTYEAAFDGSSLNSGVYFYKLITNTFSETKKMLLIK